MKRTNSKLKTPMVLLKNKEKIPNNTEDNINFKAFKSPVNNSVMQFNPNFYNQHNMSMPNLDIMNGNIHDTENIKVCIRLRPLNLMETGRGDSKCVEVVNNQIMYQNKAITRNYGFNYVFTENTSQEDLFFSSSLDVIEILYLENYRKCS
jgi:hypothetical protein